MCNRIIDEVKFNEIWSRATKRKKTTKKYVLEMIHLHIFEHTTRHRFKWCDEIYSLIRMDRLFTFNFLRIRQVWLWFQSISRSCFLSLFVLRWRRDSSTMSSRGIISSMRPSLVWIDVIIIICPINIYQSRIERRMHISDIEKYERREQLLLSQ